MKAITFEEQNELVKILNKWQKETLPKWYQFKKIREYNKREQLVSENREAFKNYLNNKYCNDIEL